MKFTSFQKAKAVLIFTFAALFILIITTPYFIRQGVSWAAEETVEGFFLAIELFALMFFFVQYDNLVRKKEEEAWLLDVKLKSKERELLSALQYLGRVNVQIKMVKSIFEKMKIPSTKSQLKEIYAELLRYVCSLSGEDCCVLRIINTETARTLCEHSESFGDRSKCESIKFGNGELLANYRKKSMALSDQFQVFFSETENFVLKAFILVPNEKKNKYSKEERGLLEAVANQCEILYLLLDSKYYKLDKNSTIKNG